MLATFRNFTGRRGATALLLAAALGLAPFSDRAADPVPGAPHGDGAVLRQLNGALERVIGRVSPAVVQVLVTGFGPMEEGGRSETGLVVRQHGIGSGVIVDPEGYILTNSHVVQGAQRIRIVLPAPVGARPGRRGAGTRRLFDAQVVGTHPEGDLAVLKIEARGLPWLSLKSSHEVRQGEIVFAIGSPEGLASTVTMGIVSSAARQPDPAIPMVFIQTDAPINPGNSGGPLVDTDGELVGINTFILTQSGGSQGLGFAIPAPMARFVYENLRKRGHVHRIEIGASAQVITPTLAAGLGLARDWGVVVSDVAPGGPSQQGGLKDGDVLDTVDGRPIDTLPALAEALYLHPADQPVRIQVLRGTDKMVLLVNGVVPRHPAEQLAELANLQKQVVARLGILGVELDDKLAALLPPLREKTGVVVAARMVDAPGIDSGLQAGDVIRSLDRTPITSIRELRDALDAARPGDPVVLQIERQGRLQYVSFEME